jgi:signal transduction histidine kinase
VAVLDRVLRHNLRNQTSVIRGYADLLSEDVPPEQVQSEIRDAADELLSISEQVRAFRSVVTGDDTHRIDVDLVETVGQAIEGVRDETREDAITLSGPGSAMIRADPTLPSALRDLIELAVQVDDPDVSIELTEENGRVLLEFVDRAGAIPTDDLRIVGGDVETPLEHLQGVGLWLIRWSVEQSSGEFSVDLEADPPVIQVRFPTART